MQEYSVAVLGVSM